MDSPRGTSQHAGGGTNGPGSGGGGTGGAVGDGAGDGGRTVRDGPDCDGDGEVGGADGVTVTVRTGPVT
jgi:hypothetical protein